jgi:MerR family transcriptional regulator, copper efflux regulator
MKIGELGKRTGVPTKTIRYYEDIGLLPEPERAYNGYREYNDDAVLRLRFIRDAQATGLALTEIASILDLRSVGEGTCHHVIELLERHLEDLDRHLENLHATRDQLITLTKRAKGLDPEDCTDPNRCQTIAAGTDAGASSRIHTDHLHIRHRSHVRP